MLEAILGVTTGFLGNLITSFTNLKTQKIKNEHELKMRDYDIQERKQEAEMQISVANAQLQGRIEETEAAAYAETLREANKPLLDQATLQNLTSANQPVWSRIISQVLVFIMGVVDAFRAVMRPGLTTYLTILTSIITFKAIDIISAKQALLSPLEAHSLFTQVTDIVIYLTVSCITWWFGDRRMAKFAMRLNDGNFRDK